MATVTELATRTLQRLGVMTVAVANRPSVTGTRSVSEMAADALRAVGVNPASPLGTESGSVAAASLATMALRRLGVIDAVEAAVSQDQAAALAVTQNVHQHVVALGLANWADGAIPSHAVEPYLLMVGAMLGQEFGRPQDIPTFELGVAGLRRAMLAGPRGQAFAEQYVREAHARLVTAGVADWAVNATPFAYAADTVAMAALLLAPVVGGKADPAALEAAEARARRGVLAGAKGLEMAEQAVKDAHFDLSARGLTRWLLTSIPREADEPYVMMASYLLGPRVGMRPNHDDWLKGERQIMRLVMQPSSGGVQTVVNF